MAIPDWVTKREQYKKGLFAKLDGVPMGLQEAIDLSIDSLLLYGPKYPHWVITYSGGKDSSALVSFIVWALESDTIPSPESLTVLYADTQMELPPLTITAQKVMAELKERGYHAKTVVPPLEKRFWATILGRGVIPPKSKLRWCTRQLKKDPMDMGLPQVWERYDKDKVLILTGVRMGESTDRDQRITASCSTDDGECGQGWYQQHEHALAPLLHWRVCWIWKWLFGDLNPLTITREIEDVYKADDFFDIRTGCIGCNLVKTDWALKTLIRNPQWEHLRPLMRLKGVYEEMAQRKHRVRYKPTPRKDGTYNPKRVNNYGALKMASRRYFYDQIVAIESEAHYPLIPPDEKAYIHDCWANDVWPDSAKNRYQDGEQPIQLIIEDGKIVGEQLRMQEM